MPADGLSLPWSVLEYRKRLTGGSTQCGSSVGTPELSTLTLNASIAELSYVPEDDDDDDENGADAVASQEKSAGERAFSRAETLLPANDVCVDTYFVAKQNASDEGIEQLIGRCYPTIRVEIDDDSADDEAGPSATEDGSQAGALAGWRALGCLKRCHQHNR